jgi:L-xylulokinase
MFQVDRPYFLPYLFGAPSGKSPGANFHQLRGWHDRRHLIASALEGITFNHLHHLSMLEEKIATNSEIHISGGAMNSPVWAQLVSDIFQRPLTLSDSDEAGALRSAILAGVGVGEFKDIEEGITQCVRVKKSYAPNSESATFFHKRFEEYRALANNLIHV